MVEIVSIPVICLHATVLNRLSHRDNFTLRDYIG
jgi:hypothetical protein